MHTVSMLMVQQYILCIMKKKSHFIWFPIDYVLPNKYTDCIICIDGLPAVCTINALANQFTKNTKYAPF